MKKHTKILFALTLTAIMICVMVAGGCKTGNDSNNATELPDITPAETAEPTPEPVTPEPVTPVPDDFYDEKTYSFIDDAALIKIDGRSEVKAKGVSCDWSAAGFEIIAAFRGDVTLEADFTGEGALTVFLDGERQSGFVKVSKKMKLISEVPEGVHSLRVVRQSEASVLKMVLKTLTINGTLLERPADRKLYLEFIGDSISVGFGTNVKSGFTTASEHTDATMAYPFIVANDLDADFCDIAVTGIGLVKGYVTETMGKVYDKLNYYRSQKTVYEPQRIPDFVVINLGTNDATHSSDTTKFVQAVKNLITQVRTLYGRDVPILWVYNSMRADYSSHTLKAIEELGGEDAGLYTLKLKADASAYGHPSAEAHKRHAQMIEEFLRDKLGIAA